MQKDSNAFDQIVWGEPQLRDANAWAMNVNVVQMLCAMGSVTQWQEGTKGKDGYIKMPYRYDISGLQVDFLPHWGFYTVGGVDLDVPQTKENVTMAVDAVRILQSLGFVPKKR